MFVVIFFNTIYNKTIIRFGFCDILNNQGFGKCYQPRLSARLITLTWTLISPNISQKPHPIIVYYSTSYKARQKRFVRCQILLVMWACKVLVEVQHGLGCNSVLVRLKSLGVATHRGWGVGRGLSGIEKNGGTKGIKKPCKCRFLMLYLF